MIYLFTYTIDSSVYHVCYSDNIYFLSRRQCFRMLDMRNALPVGLDDMQMADYFDIIPANPEITQYESGEFDSKIYPRIEKEILLRIIENINI